MLNYDTNLYKAEIDRWIDGDTVDMHVDLGFRIHHHCRFRVVRIDAPEIRRRKGVTDAEVKRGKALTEFLQSQWPAGTHCIIAARKATDRYGRWLAEIYLELPDHDQGAVAIPDEIASRVPAGFEPEGIIINLSDWLIERGLVELYDR